MAIAKCECGYSKTLDDKHIGKKGKCPKCKETIYVKDDTFTFEGDASLEYDMQKCPFCAEEIKKEAVKCKHCGEYIEDESEDESYDDYNYNEDGSEEEYVEKIKKPLLVRLSIAFVGIICVIGAILSIVNGNLSACMFFVTIFILFYLVANLGFKLGDLFLKFARPDLFFASGAIDMAKKRFFWLIGPQLISLAISLALAVVISFLIFGASFAPETHSAIFNIPNALQK